jgi:hypothetical protein
LELREPPGSCPALGVRGSVITRPMAPSGPRGR